MSAAKRTPRERFTDNFDAAKHQTLSGAAGDALAANIPGPEGQYERDKLKDEATAYALRSESDPWYEAPGGIPGKAIAGAATLGGVLAGGLTSPESLIGPGKTIVGRIAGNAAVNAGTDVPVQGLQNLAGTAEGFDPWRVVMSGATGALTQGAFEVGGAGARAGGKAIAKATDAAKPVIGKAARAVGEGARSVAQSAGRVLDGWSVAQVAPSSMAPAEAPSNVGGDIGRVVREAAARAGVDPDTAFTIAKLESGLDPQARNPKSSAAGVFQFTDETWNAMGGGDKTDPALSAARGAELLKTNQGALAGALGREPEGWEIYLAHQQGANGASALLRAGDLPAIDALKAAGVSAKRARASILQNGGRADMTAAEFAALWRDKYAKASGGPTAALAIDLAPSVSAPDQFYQAAPSRSIEEPSPGFGDLPQPAEPTRPTEHPQDAFLSEMLSDLSAGNNNARLLPDYDVDGFRSRLERQGWRLDPESRDWVSPEGHSLFVRGQGDLAHPVVQYRAGTLAPDNSGLSPATAGGDDIPIPKRAQPRAPAPAPAARARDLTDEALDVLRSGGRVRDNRPTLLDWLSREGLRDDGGELSNIGAHRWHTEKAFRRQLVRPDWRTLEDAALAAQELGYLPERFGDGVDTRPTAQELIDAISEGIAGRHRYASEAPELDELRAHVQDLDEVLTHIGADPRKLSNDELRAQIEAYYRQPADEIHEGALASRALDPTSLETAGERLGMAPRGRKPSTASQRVQSRMAADAAHAPRAKALAEAVTEIEGHLKGLKLDAHVSRDGVLTVSRIVVPTEMRSNGVGSAVMGRLTEFADKHGLRMALTPSDAFGGSVPRLRQFYSRFGFEPNKGRGRDLAISESMVRRANGHTDKLGAIDLSNYQQQIAGASSAASRNIGGLRAAPRPGAVPKGSGEEYAGATVSRLADQLRKALGITHRQGRMTLKGGAVGEYDPNTAVIRTKAMQEIDVLSHEATHALEYKKGPALMAALKAHADELKLLAYEGANPKHLRQEGFAEFGRWYITNPDHAQKIAPKFYEAFEEALYKDAPAILRDLKDIQAAYKNLLMSASVDVAAGSVAYTGRPGPLTRMTEALRQQGLGGVVADLSDRAWTWFVDDLHPLNVGVRKLQDIYAANHSGHRMELNAGKNPYVLARLAKEAYAAGHLDITEGVVPYGKIDAEGPSLSDALEHALGAKGLGKWSEKDLAEFDAYLIARRSVHEWKRYEQGELPNPPDKTNGAAFHQQVIKDLEAAHPTWKEAAQLVYDWNEALWLKRYEAGFITREAYEHGLATHPDYVPLLRDVSDKKDAGSLNRPRGSLQHAGGVKQYKGSTRDVISPLSSMMREAYELNGLIKRNDTIKALDDLAQVAGPGAGAIIERLPAKQVEAINVDALEALTRAAHEAGVSERDLISLTQAAETALGDATQATIFRQKDFDPRKGEAVVFVWRDGKKTPLLLADGEFGQEMFTAITGMNADMRNGLVDAMAGISSILRTGVTLSPEFMARNIVRDQISVWINTDVGYVPGFHYAKGAAEQVANGQFAKRNAMIGGMRGGMNTEALRRPTPRDDAEAKAQLQNLRHKGMRLRTFNPFQRNPLNALAALTDVSEAGTRLSVLKLAFDKAKRRGLNDIDALAEAGITSRDYLDFSMQGSVSRALGAGRVLTFMNASVQGLMKNMRVLSGSGLDRPQAINVRRLLAPFGKAAPRTQAEKDALALAYKAWAKIAALAILGGTLRAMYADDPEYEEISDNLRATHWFFRGFGGHWVGIPKPFSEATPSNIVERLFERTVLEDESAMKRIWSDLKHTMAPPFANPLVSAYVGVAKNRDYNGRPVIPDHLKGAVDPELQYSAYTSEIGKLIGQTFKVSPAVVDYVVTTMGGSLGRYALQGSTLAHDKLTGKPSTASGPEDMFISRGFIRDVSRGSVSQKKFWELVSRDGGKLTQAEGTFRSHMQAGNDERATAYLNTLSPAARAYVQAKVFASGASGAHPLVRAQKAVAVIGDLRQEVRDATLTGMRGEPIELTAVQRKEVDDALAKMAMTEMRNALISTGQEGWTKKEMMTRRVTMEDLEHIDPALTGLVRARLLEQHVIPAGQASMIWQQMRPVFEAKVEPGRLGQLMDAKRLTSSDPTAKREEVIRQLQRRNLLPAPPTSNARPIIGASSR